MIRSLTQTHKQNADPPRLATKHRNKTMKLKKYTIGALSVLAAGVAAVSFTSCGGESASATSDTDYSAEQVAEALYTVLFADRKVYASKIVTRLANKEKVIKAHEDWMEEKALLLPAQMFREGAETVDGMDKPFGFTYSLQSLWPLNMENAKKRTPKVMEGLEAVSTVGSPDYGKKWSGEEEINGQKYFVTTTKLVKMNTQNSKRVTSWEVS